MSSITQYPKVSIVMPVFNGEKTVLTAALSVLEQSYSNLELVVVDDGSTDETLNTLNTIKDERLKIVSYSVNRGRPYARQQGLNACDGRFLAMVDADDWWVSDKLERQMNCFNSDPSLTCVSAGMFIVDQVGVLRGARTGDGVTMSCIVPYDISLPHASSVIKMDVAKGASYNESLRYGQDVDYLRKCLLGKKYIVLKDCLYVYAEYGSVGPKKHLLTYLYSLRSSMHWWLEFPLASIKNTMVLAAKVVVTLFYVAMGRHESMLKNRSTQPDDSEIEKYETYKKVMENLEQKG